MTVCIIVSIIESPLGPLEIKSNDKGQLVSISYLDGVDDYFIEVAHKPIVERLCQYFAGNMEQDLAFNLCRDRLTDFQVDVYKALLKVPYGRTISYGELAEQSGHEGAYRAVGTAMKNNPFPIVVPCHRVIKGDGSLGYYNGGVDKKKFLLNLERQS